MATKQMRKQDKTKLNISKEEPEQNEIDVG
jgi:hypothetical protein